MNRVRSSMQEYLFLLNSFLLKRALLNYDVSKMVTLFSNSSFGRNFLITISILIWATFSNSLIAEDNASNLPAIKKVKEGIYDFGGIIIDRKSNSVSIPAFSNQVNGLVEYGVVHEDGKIHESLFRTSIRPQIFHTSFLLLKFKPVEGFFQNLWSDDPKPIDYSENCFEILVSWEINGTMYEKEIEKLSINQNRNGPIKKKSFIFTGSKMIEGTFLAESSGSILAIYSDESAVMNNSDYDSSNDDVWIANKDEMPPLELPVLIRFHLPQ